MKRYHFTEAIITALLLAMVIAALIYLVKYEIPERNKEVLLMLIGAITAKFCDAIGYWFNSSRGSQAKDAIIANSQPLSEK
jgi:hypothetical protein